MVGKLIAWAVANPLVVLILTAALAVGGGYAFTHVNIEAYPDPAPAIIEVVAQFPGASAEEVERQVTVPLEVALAGMPGLETTRSKSLFGLSHVRNQFNYSRDYDQAKQDVLNRLAAVNLPPGVVPPQISPASPIGEILRYTIENPRDPDTGQPLYTLSDLKAVQDYVLQREIARVDRVAGVTGVGGTVKRYEVQPDPARLRQYGVTLSQLQTALGGANANGSGDNLTQGQLTIVVRSLGLLGNGQDPMQATLAMTDPRVAAAFLRGEEARRCREIRQVVVASVNNVPVRVDNLVDGGPCLNADGTPRVDDARLVSAGVVVGRQTRQGRVAISRPRRDADGNRVFDADGHQEWDDEDDVIQGIVLLRKGKESLPALSDVTAKIAELNRPGNMPPGIKIVPYYNRTDLINRTTETVHENLLVGMALVTAILLLFLGNVRAAVIVAINIPLALMFAFGVLFARGKSANLLSIGAVDFGIIVDSSVIIVESIYRNLTHAAGRPGAPVADRILAACGQVTKSLFFATVIMVCALLPLFTMTGPEGQIFGPMADTYAFALGGALVLALTVSPVLCLLLMKKLKPKPDNVLVRGLRWLFLAQLRLLLKLRWLALAGFVAVLAYTGVTAAHMGREFMPELEEGNLMVRGTFPVNVSLAEVTERSRQLRALLRRFPEFAVVVPTIGRPDDGTDPTGYYNCETFLPLRPEPDWPVDPARGRPRKKAELVHDLDAALEETFPGVDFDVSQIIRDNVMEALSGVKGENSIKVFGPDLDTLEDTAFAIRDVLNAIPGVQNAGVFRVQGQSGLEFPVDRQKCARWNVSPADVQAVVQAAVGGRPATQMQEGGKAFDVTVRWPEKLRGDEQAVLAVPVPVGGNQVTPGSQVAAAPSPVGGAAVGLSPTGTTVSLPAATGDTHNAPATAGPPVRRLSDLVTPLNAQGVPDDEHGSFLRPGASTIYREQGRRLIAIKFEVRGRDLASTVAEARAKVDPLVKVPYRAEWSGEFKQMEAAEGRMAKMFAASLVLIVLFLYLAFRNFLDTAVVFANVLAMGVGGVWALKLTGLNFNISAAVGFISVLGVAVMNGLLFVSAFNGMRAHGVELTEALVRGTGQLVRPVVMTALAAILGLLPAALSTKMGSESQKPLAVVVVGGMLFTVLALNLVPVLYSFYGGRTPPAGAGDLAH